MYKKYLDDIKYCIKNFDVDESNYNVFTPSELGQMGGGGMIVIRSI